MPIVPTQPKPISMDVPGIAEPANTMLPNAISAVGNQIADTSLDFLEQIKKEEAVDASATKFQQRMLESEQKQMELQTAFPTGYITDEKGERVVKDGSYWTITQEYREWANKHYEADQLGMPSRMAQQLYQEQAGKYYTESMLRVQNHQLVMNVDALQNSVRDATKKIGTQLIQSPNVATAYYGLDGNILRITEATGRMDKNGQMSGFMSANQAHDEKLIAGQDTSAYLFEGLYNASVAHDDPVEQVKAAEYGLRVLYGQDEDSMRRKQTGSPIFSDLITPEKKAAYARNFMGLIEGDGKNRDNDWRAMVEDEKAARINGKSPNPVFFQKLKETVALSKDKDTKTNRSRIVNRVMNELNVWEAAGQVSREMRKTNPARWDAIQSSLIDRTKALVAEAARRNPELDAAGSKNYGEATIQEAKDWLAREAHEILSAQKKDAAAYVYKEYPTYAAKLRRAGSDPVATSKVVSQILKTQSDLGIPEHYQRLITRDQSLGYSKGLNSKDPAVVSKQLTELQKKYGVNYFDHVWNQIMGDNNIPESATGLAVVGRIADPTEREDAIATVVNAPHIQKAYEEQIPKSERANLEAASSEAINPFLRSLNAISGQGNSLAYSNHMNAIYRSNVQKIKLENRGLGDKEISDRALNMFKKDYIISEAAGYVIAPRAQGGTTIRQDVLEAYMTTHKSPKALEKMKILVPNSLRGQGDYTKKTPNEKKALWFRNIEQRGAWVTNAAFDGMALMIIESGQAPVPVKNSKGQRFEIKFKDTQVQDEFTKEALKPGFMEKIFNMFSDESGNN